MAVPTRSDPPKGELPWTGKDVASFRKALLAFFARSARELPWRGGDDDPPDPYRILVSEVMLQQTRVETVIPYFRRWMERFPTAEALAKADLDEVLSTWQGLGYYSRARNLHGAVREVAERYDGEIPNRPDALETLPGVGPYTAGAVASIAFGVPAPAVDGNVRRVLARLMDDPDPSPGRLRSWASALVDADRPGDFNQALMELGALVCTPREPSCEECPVASFCAARAAGTERERPAPPRKRTIPRVREAVAALARSDGAKARILLRRRGDRGLLAGMWELPGRPIGKGDDPLAASVDLAFEIVRALTRGGLEEGGDPPENPFRSEPEALSSLDHAFSHRKVRYLPFHFEVRPELIAEAGPDTEPDLRWTGPDELDALPIPTAQRRLVLRALQPRRST